MGKLFICCRDILYEHKSIFEILDLIRFNPQNSKKLNNSLASDIQVCVTQEENWWQDPRHFVSKSASPVIQTDVTQFKAMDKFRFTWKSKLFPNTRHPRFKTYSKSPSHMQGSKLSPNQRHPTNLLFEIGYCLFSLDKISVLKSELCFIFRWTNYMLSSFFI